MVWKRLLISLALMIATAILVGGCGGGGESPQSLASSGPLSAVAWDPPRTYVDNSPLDPLRELDYYEFYVRTDQNFTENDAPVAQAAAVTNILSPDGRTYTPELTWEFYLTNLRPFAQPGKVYYVSIRAVGVDGLKSQFSQPISWEVI